MNLRNANADPIGETMNTSSSEFEIRVSDRIRLTGIRDTDKDAFCRWLTDKDIYDRTLRIPRPYTERDARELPDPRA